MEVDRKAYAIVAGVMMLGIAMGATSPVEGSPAMGSISAVNNR